ncbi:hypothetical protein F511_09148 [Dorcoceras hygrometricum]|uniref:Uncharacterized protein n=1 Tax=Dorcoceras hygrometricum TaxID=472368 RepID=A0A2Z7AQH7_9LAMI|nr:hypothetical protein F511_09148 [Dorcoceras hygrometricum]
MGSNPSTESNYKTAVNNKNEMQMLCMKKETTAQRKLQQKYVSTLATRRIGEMRVRKSPLTLASWPEKSDSNLLNIRKIQGIINNNSRPTTEIHGWEFHAQPTTNHHNTTQQGAKSQLGNEISKLKPKATCTHKHTVEDSSFVISLQRTIDSETSVGRVRALLKGRISAGISCCRKASLKESKS